MIENMAVVLKLIFVISITCAIIYGLLFNNRDDLKSEDLELKNLVDKLSQQERIDLYEKINEEKQKQVLYLHLLQHRKLVSDTSDSDKFIKDLKNDKNCS